MAGMPGSVVGMPGSLTDIDPMLHAAISSKEVGKEDLNGAPTTKYQLDVDLEKLATAAGAPPEELGNSSLTMLLWVGDTDMYVHQFSIMLNAESTSGDITLSLMMDLTVTFSDFDVPVTITAPPNAEPIDLGAGPIVSMPTTTSAGMPRTGSGTDNTMLLVLLAVSIGLVLSGVAVRRAARTRYSV